MKRLVTILLIAVLAYNAIGFVVSFQVVRHEWHLSVCEQLLKTVNEKEATIFKFPTKNDKAFKDEISIDGQFYDVIHRDIQGDSVVITCFSDETETHLFAQFYDDIQRFTTSNTDFQGKAQFLLSSLVKDFLFDNEHILKTPPSVFKAFLSIPSARNAFLPICFLETIAPPPKVV